MTEPRYDEDGVNLGYLKRLINNETSETDSITISKHYSSKPNPPYYAGDTWTDGPIVYTCIKTRLIGLYNDSDWTTESGAKEEAESKNKIFLTQPSNYSIGDMWILQTDMDHKSGKKGEILITTVSRKMYDEDDWVNMLGYGTIRSINEVANNINDALRRLEIVKENGILTIYYTNTIPEAIENDLWYVTDDTDTYIKGNVYKYNGTDWVMVDDNLSVIAFEEANETRLVSDGKIQSFYSEAEPSQNIDVGDIWTETTTQRLYRYNGTKWVAVYDTNVNQVREDIEIIRETTVNISTDLGKITQEVSETEKKISDDIDTIKQEQKVLSTQQTQTASDFNYLFNTLQENVNANSEETNNKFIEISKYIRFVDGNIVLGEIGNELTLNIKKDRISFLQNNVEVAYLSNNKLYVTDGEFLNSLKLGNFAFMPRTNGNLSFKKVGGN